MRTNIFLTTLVISLLTTVSAYAWDFSCSPESSTEVLTAVPPNVMLMLDRSGSMNWHGATNTCNVCQDRYGKRFAVSGYSECKSLNRRNKYWGTKTWGNPCGSATRWDLALGAIRAVTSYSDNQSPQLASFGLGMFQSGRAYLVNECVSPNHDAIDASLSSAFPGGGTPTAAAIQTSYESECLAAGREDRVISKSTGKNVWNRGYDFYYQFDNLPRQGADMPLEVGMIGDFGSSCELIEVFADNVSIGVVGGSGADCSYQTSTLYVPAHLADDGLIEIKADTRADNEILGSCRFEDGVEASCNSNEITMTLNFAPQGTRPQFAATVLINDGAPTQTLATGSSGNARTDAMIQACAHRRQAPLFVVGLGSGTDIAYNNVLAAAGGSGTCTVGGVEVDPCSAPSSWGSLSGSCTGSIQTGNDTELIAAISGITESLGCIYPVNFDGSAVTEVPEDPTGEYQYLSVSLRMADGSTEDVYFEGNPLAGSRNWKFYDNARNAIQFSDGLCDDVNIGAVRDVGTQLACLCEQEESTECEVPNSEALGVCPTGVWQCSEGTDWCEPEAYCCTDGTPCTVEGAEGVCAQGGWDCATESCAPIVEPSAETCDGLDNNCNGVIDDIEAVDCTVPGEVGRCAVGLTECVNAELFCRGYLDPMPELCNGLDDDCDGVTDNITGSWDKAEFSALTLNAPEKACLMADACVCPGPSDDHAGMSFDEYVDAWDPSCHCGSALEVNESVAPASSSSGSEPQGASAGCSTAGGSGDGIWLLSLMMIVGRIRRRK